jgi:hypothetical protein
MTKTRRKPKKPGSGMRPTAAAVESARALGYVSMAEAARELGVAVTTISGWIGAGKLPRLQDDREPAIKVGPFRWVFLASVRAMKPDLAAAAGAKT